MASRGRGGRAASKPATAGVRGLTLAALALITLQAGAETERPDSTTAEARGAATSPALVPTGSIVAFMPRMTGGDYSDMLGQIPDDQHRHRIDVTSDKTKHLPPSMQGSSCGSARQRLRRSIRWLP